MILNAILMALSRFKRSFFASLSRSILLCYFLSLSPRYKNVYDTNCEEKCEALSGRFLCDLRVFIVQS